MFITLHRNLNKQDVTNPCDQVIMNWEKKRCSVFDIQSPRENLVDVLRFTLSKLSKKKKKYNNHGDISNSVGLLTLNTFQDIHWICIDL